MTRNAPNTGAVEGVGKNRSSKIHIEKNLSKRKIASQPSPRLLIHLRNLNVNVKDVDAGENQVAQMLVETLVIAPEILPGDDFKIDQHTTLHIADNLHYHN